MQNNSEKISQVSARADKNKEYLEKDINDNREEMHNMMNDLDKRNDA